MASLNKANHHQIEEEMSKVEEGNAGVGSRPCEDPTACSSAAVSLTQKVSIAYATMLQRARLCNCVSAKMLEKICLEFLQLLFMHA